MLVAVLVVLTIWTAETFADRSFSSVSSTGSTRKRRFPSVDERVKLYMGNWYSPPCDSSDGIHYFEQNESIKTSFNVKIPSSTGNSSTTYEILARVEADRIFVLQTEELAECAKLSNVPQIARGEQESTEAFKLKKKALILKTMRLYCLDALDSLVPALLHAKAELDTTEYFPPLLVQFGDLQHSHEYGFLNVPHFKKYRRVATKEEVSNSASPLCLSGRRNPLCKSTATSSQDLHLQPIVWKLSVSRHYSRLPLVEQQDISWNHKKPMAVFRGELTGSLKTHDPYLSDEENCLQWPRCRLVYRNSHSSLVDAKLTSTRKRMPNVLNGVSLVASKMPLEGMMEYKAVIMLEGNGAYFLFFLVVLCDVGRFTHN